MKTLSEAVILMAGSGSRLRVQHKDFLKPLIPVRGRPLISYTIDALARSGIRAITAVVGYEGVTIMRAVETMMPAHVELRFVENREWQKQNGISLLAAADVVKTPFFLTMSDHIFDAAIVDLIREGGARDRLNIAIDRKLDSIFDIDDATKVQTRAHGIEAIGKNLQEFDAIDTGVFVCPPEIFSYLEQAKQNDDCSLTDAVRLMAADDKVRCIDIGEAWWQDVDTSEMLRHAEKMIARTGAAATVA
ncbi:MAG: 1L-myo-inositol 1-phosphate cytidylyltransferase [Verrucomicrobiota bacterium]|jgi:choline kinase